MGLKRIRHGPGTDPPWAQNGSGIVPDQAHDDGAPQRARGVEVIDEVVPQPLRRGARVEKRVRRRLQAALVVAVVAPDHLPVRVLHPFRGRADAPLREDVPAGGASTCSGKVGSRFRTILTFHISGES
eukprot:gene1854-biopygen4806